MVQVQETRQTFHSKFNAVNCDKASKIAMLPLGEEDNIIDEALSLFRCQVMFKSFKPQGDADHVLMYLTVFIQHCLRDIQKYEQKNKSVDRKAAEGFLTKLANSPIPDFDSKDFFLIGVLGTDNQMKAKGYLTKACLEAVKKLLNILWNPDHGDCDLKYWVNFSRQNFVGWKYNKSISYMS